MSEIKRATATDAGLWLAGASSRTADELSAAIVDVAVARGMVLSQEDRDIRAEFSSGWAADGDLGYELSDMAIAKAIDWLNNNIRPRGYHFEQEDGLIMIANDECGCGWGDDEED